MSRGTKRAIMAAAAVAALGAGGAAIAVAAGGGDDKPITGAALGKASAAALNHTGGGQVTGSEIGDEDSYYEVEVKRTDGSSVDVQLDRGFKVVGSAADKQEKGDKDSATDR